jgi:Fe-S-cluster containining protein
LSLIEARRIADGLGLLWEKFLASYVDQRWADQESFLLCQRDGMCVFLEQAEGKNKATCLIHPFKPSSCVDWTPSLFRRECREGLAQLWGLDVNILGEIQGPEEAIRSFHSFLESLT